MKPLQLRCTMPWRRPADQIASRNIVTECTDAYVVPKPPLMERKVKYIWHIAHASKSVRLVSATDKLHNARSILKDYRVEGEALWSGFNVGMEETLWSIERCWMRLRGEFIGDDEGGLAD